MNEFKFNIVFNFNTLPVFIILLLPIFIILGSGILNFTIIILDILYLAIIINRKNTEIFKNTFFYLLLIIWAYLLINFFFLSSNLDNSFLRSIGFLRFIIFVFAIKYFLEIEENKYFNLIFKSWAIIFIFISIDLLYEFLFGKNILGFSAELPGRLVGFLKDEMKIGHLYSLLIIISIITIFEFLKKNESIKSNLIKKNLFYLLVLSTFIISFLIGERANFIRIFFMISLFLFFFQKNLKTNILIILIGISFFIILTLNNEQFKKRFWTTFMSPLIRDPISTLFIAPYGDHYKAALEVYSNNKIFGVGLRNYPQEAAKNKFEKNSSVHPHQIYFEFLSELGLVGFVIFLYFFIYSLFLRTKSYIKKKDPYILGAILFMSAQILPFIPTGSFFTTYGATLFWMNYAILITDKK